MHSDDFDMAPISLGCHQTYEEQVAEKFKQLVSLNLNDKAESKNGLTYVSWANAWKAFKEVYPTATYQILKDPKTNMPYFVDPLLGIMVFTEVSANGLTYQMWLPVLNEANKAMKTEPYTYQVWDRSNRQYVEKKVEAASMYECNRTAMRCLVKNLAMFGIGLYIYSGEDMPDEISDESATIQQPRSVKRKSGDRLGDIKRAIYAAKSTQELTTLYYQHENEVKGDPNILALFTARKEELQTVA